MYFPGLLHLTHIYMAAHFPCLLHLTHIYMTLTFLPCFTKHTYTWPFTFPGLLHLYVCSM
jgi:hypothetical protein